MHILVSWDISSSNKNTWNQINGELKECLKRYSWVKPLTTLYIVKINYAQQRETIKNNLVAVCQNHKGVNFVIGPVIESGGYGGWLPKSMWPKISERTDGGASW